MRKRSELALAGNIDKVTRIQDNILEAFKIYYQEQSSKLKHDCTVEATVVDVSEKSDGVYTVQSEGARFKAYAIAGSYYTNEQVLVSIPNGDYNNQKFILGRKTDDDTINTTFSFKLPFDDFIGLQEVNEEVIYGGQYWANKPAEDEQLIYEFHTNEGSLLGCTKLGIEMDVVTLLSQYNPSRGTYGVRIVIGGTKGTSETYRSEDFTKEVYFTNYDMYGNTYAYSVPYTQQKVIDISEFLTVKDLKIYFFQDYCFADSANKYILYADQPANIELSNIKMFFGVTADEMQTEKTFLWTFDDLNYGETAEKKTLHFAWVHKEDNGNFSTIKDLTGLEKQKEKTGYEPTAIHWYRFEYGTVIEDSTSPEKYGGVNWKWLSEFDNEFEITITPDPLLSREKYKVAVAHDGIYTVSDELIFQNYEDIEGITANDEIIFKCFRTVTDTEGNVTLVEDNAIDSFYVYDENNRVLKNDDLESFADIEYYLQLYVRNNDLGEYVPLNVFDQGQNTGTSVAWAYPQSFTMFKTFEVISVNDKPFAAYDPDSNEFKNLQKITTKFKIKSNLDVRYIDNTVSAVITRGDREYYVHREFQFGRAGSFGHEVVPVIKIVNPKDGYYLPIKGYFELKCELYGRDGQPFNVAHPQFTWTLIGGAQITEDIVGNGEMVVSSDTVKGVLQNEIPPIFEVTVSNAADYPITIRKGFLIGNDPKYMQEHVILVPDRVEFKSDGATPVYYSNQFEVQKISEDASKNQMLYPDWNISNTKLVNLYKREFEAGTFDRADGSTITREAYNDYALRFTAKGTPQWTKALASDDYFTYIYYRDQENKYVAQSIAFDKNEYPSSLINSWNGTDLTIDQENSAIMSRMIMAGTKDTKNRFTGVAMGDWSSKGDESLEQAGLYGFMNGEQSFAFKKDGTGFIGPSGKGRIEFDGTQALISNADKTCYINLNPVSIDSGIYDLSNRSFSQNFLYAEVPRVEGITNSYLPEDSAYWTNKYFNDPAYADKDYFIVDPNNGILTTGGIIAKYGRLGNWYIGNQGLYQKTTVNLGEDEKPKYMFLGYDGKSLDGYTKEKEKIETWYEEAIQQANDTYANNEVTLAEELKRLQSEYTSKIDNIWNNVQAERFCIFTGANEYQDPSFSVTWDGTLSARKGQIGKTSPWYIDDNGLTQENKFGRIYLGNPTKNPHNPWYFDTDKTTAAGSTTLAMELEALKNLFGHELIQMDSTGSRYEKSDGEYVGFAISAGEKTSGLTASADFDTMSMKFGVRLDGFLYSTKGLIGGWNITNTELVSVDAGIRMSSSNSYIVVGKGPDSNLENYSIILDGKRGILSINNQQTNTSAGEIRLAGYTLHAITGGSITYPYKLDYTVNEKKYDNIATFSDGNYSNSTSWGDGGAVSISGSVVKPPNGTFLSVPEEQTGTASLTIDKPNLLGIVDNITDTETFGLGIATGIISGKKSIVLYPTGVTATAEECYASLGSSGNLWNIYANIIDCAGLNTAGYLAAKSIYMNNELVATQPYVYNLLVDIWKALDKTKSGVGSNAGSIAALGADLAKAAITGIEVTGGITTTGNLDIGVLYKLGPNQTTGDTDHIEGGIDMTHTHSITGTMSADGTLTITWGATNYGPGASKKSTIDCSAWLDAARQEGYQKALDNSGANTSYNMVEIPTGTYKNPSSTVYTANLEQTESDTHKAVGRSPVPYERADGTILTAYLDVGITGSGAKYKIDWTVSTNT